MPFNLRLIISDALHDAASTIWQDLPDRRHSLAAVRQKVKRRVGVARQRGDGAERHVVASHGLRDLEIPIVAMVAAPALHVAPGG